MKRNSCLQIAASNLQHNDGIDHIKRPTNIFGRINESFFISTRFSSKNHKQNTNIMSIKTKHYNLVTVMLFVVL